MKKLLTILILCIGFGAKAQLLAPGNPGDTIKHYAYEMFLGGTNITGGGGGSTYTSGTGLGLSGSQFYVDSTNQASVKRLKDTAAALRLAIGSGGGGGTPGGGNTQVQTNSGGAFAGSPDFTFGSLTPSYMRVGGAANNGYIAIGRTGSNDFYITTNPQGLVIAENNTGNYLGIVGGGHTDPPGSLIPLQPGTPNIGAIGNEYNALYLDAFLSLKPISTAPGTPSSGAIIYLTTSGDLIVKGSNGNTVTIGFGLQ